MFGCQNLLFGYFPIATIIFYLLLALMLDNFFFFFHSYVVCMCVCILECEWANVCVGRTCHMYVHLGQRCLLGIFLNWSSFYLLRQDL